MWTGPAESSFQPFQNDEELHLDYLDQGNLKSVKAEGKDVFQQIILQMQLLFIYVLHNLQHCSIEIKLVNW